MPYIGLFSLVVRDYDEAIAFYTQKLGFELIEDTELGDQKRWIVVAPKGATETRVLLARANNKEQNRVVGHQTGGRVGFFLNTDDFARDHKMMCDAGVHFLEAPRHEPYGTVAVFEDLYGNKWDLLELKS